MDMNMDMDTSCLDQMCWFDICLRSIDCELGKSVSQEGREKNEP